MRRTKIVCTIGPASESEKTLSALIQAGMDVARLNFSHGDYRFHASMIERIRRIARRLDRNVAILQDLQGPKIRVGEIAGGQTQLRSGRRVTLTSRHIVGGSALVPVAYRRLDRIVKKGDRILMGDGEIELEALRARRGEVDCRVVVGGALGAHKGVHFPQASVDIPSLTAKDRRDLAFGLEHGVDLVALSFVRRPEDIRRARREIKRRGGVPPLVAKIEKHEALDHIDAILAEVDAIMVARGDLGLETAVEKIPALQKMLILKANAAGKPVITATQMLRSMTENPRPTRAEVADVANAVLDGTDALMLSEESAAGNYPIRAVQTMARIAAEAEAGLEPRMWFDGLVATVPEAISHAAVALARDLSVKAFLIPTTSGGTARMIARYRPAQPLIAMTPDPKTVKALTLSWGVSARLIPRYPTTDAMVKMARDVARRSGLVRRGDLIAITAGRQPGT
ncbi:MAG TPA: pyruvate kinase, partial [Candidatus Binatia bacterium]|nr:pyruvate kinase [Candidatus Binatia bacterium]